MNISYLKIANSITCIILCATAYAYNKELMALNIRLIINAVGTVSLISITVLSAIALMRSKTLWTGETLKKNRHTCIKLLCWTGFWSIMFLISFSFHINP